MWVYRKEWCRTFTVGAPFFIKRLMGGVKPYPLYLCTFWSHPLFEGCDQTLMYTAHPSRVSDKKKKKKDFYLLCNMNQRIGLELDDGYMCDCMCHVTIK